MIAYSIIDMNIYNLKNSTIYIMLLLISYKYITNLTTIDQE